ncbi:MAG: glucuronate isomerase [Dictyoglomus sp.]
MLIKEKLEKLVEDSLRKTKIIDIHTHLYPPFFDKFFLRGIDDLLTYHYLVAETLRFIEIDPQTFYSLLKKEQAEIVWETLFIKRSPLSEAARGVLTILKEYGLDPNSKNLEEYRSFFNSLNPKEHINLVFEKANIDFVVMTNDPFDKEEMKFWNKEKDFDSRFKPSLRLDTLVNNWEEAFLFLREMGYEVSYEIDQGNKKEIKKFLEAIYNLMNPLYLAISLPPDYRYPDNSLRNRILEEIIIPFAQEYKLTVALMIGVKRRINPLLRNAGDSLGKADISAVENLCKRFPEVKFLVTMLSRENQHELCVTARKFKNLMPFGCWWFLNTPLFVEEITRMRFELLGLSFIPQHSDARVLDQLIYKWKHSIEIIKRILVEKYLGLVEAGWEIKEEDIKRDLNQLFKKNFEEYCLKR